MNDTIALIIYGVLILGFAAFFLLGAGGFGENQ